MALQGTIDAFPLTDVLALLSSSDRSGRLVLDGDRGHAGLWIDQGAVIGGDTAGPSGRAALLVFEMLRFSDGSFVFDAPTPQEESPTQVVEPVALTDCVEEATALLEEWARIESVVPSGRHVVRLAPEPPATELTVGADEWRVLVAVGDGPSVATAARRLDLDEFGVSESIAAMVERSLLIIDEPRDDATGCEVDAAFADPGGEPASDGPSELHPTTTPDAGNEPLADDAGPEGATPAADDDVFPERFPIDDLVADDPDTDRRWTDDGDDASAGSRFAAAQTFEPLGGEDLGGFDRDPLMTGAPELSDRTAEAWDEVVAAAQSASTDDAHAAAARSDDTADEVLRQMSRLSPKAAEAIAAALNTPAAPAPPVAAAPTTSADRTDDGPVSFLGTF